nr:Hsp70 family protein [Sphingomicrobium lutaoense]
MGTSNSAIVCNGEDGLRHCKTIEGRDILPSVIFEDRRGNRFVGAKAYDQGLLSPQNVAAGFKRLMGTDTVIELKASGTKISPVEASAEIIRTLLTQAKTELGDFDVEGAVVTIPAAFNQLQSEATIQAANDCDIEFVGLLQEPIAAALASLENAKNKSGQFLVYDLGGGTFDVALVQSVKGAVTILAHEGINMLGGRDFDKAIVNSIVRPWLQENFDLADDFQKQPQFQRLIRLAQLKSEQAKIELSGQESATIFISEEEARSADDNGEEIYVEVEITRTDLERLISDQVDATIALCKKVLADNGYSNDDIDRVVMIGGPSKMAAIRERVPTELGIPVDLKTDPMTAVARGAAIFAESRDWSGTKNKKKSAISSKEKSGSVSLKYDYEARTSSDEVRVKATVLSGDATGMRIHAETDDGWKSGAVSLDNGPVIRVSLNKLGKNRVRILVTDSSGSVRKDVSETLEIVKTAASAAGAPATHALAVKIVDGSGSFQRNFLKEVLAKGTTLPTSQTTSFRAAKTLKANESDHIDVELYQQAEGVPEPENNLFVGLLRISNDLLDEGRDLHRGDEVHLHLNVDENGIVNPVVELPTLDLRIEQKSIYLPQLGQLDFSSENGRAIVGEAVISSDNAIDQLQDDLGDRVSTEIRDLRRRQERLFEALNDSTEPDDLRLIAESARHIKQDISRIRHSEGHRQAVLTAELGRVLKLVERAQEGIEVDGARERAAQIHDHIKRSLADRKYDDAEYGIDQLQHFAFELLRANPGFVVSQFRHIASLKHLAIDPALHDRLVANGLAKLESEDVDGLNSTIAEIYSNLAIAADAEHDLAAVADLMSH